LNLHHVAINYDYGYEVYRQLFVSFNTLLGGMARLDMIQ